MIKFFLTVLMLNSMDITILKNNKEIDIDKFNKLITKNNIIYVGEIHTSTFSHYIQLEVIKTLYQQKGKEICVGFEMLNKTLQPILDEYINGKIEENEFLNKVNWQKEWGFDYNLYKPIFDFIREKNLKAIALNVPRKIVSKVARGGIYSLSEEEKLLIAKEIEIVKDSKYNNYLKETFYSHGENPMNKIMTFENYKLSMAVWNESMGEVIIDFLNKNPSYSVVVIAGNGHIMYNSGIPWSVKRRNKKLKGISIYTEEIQNLDKNYIQKISEYADLIIIDKEVEKK